LDRSYELFDVEYYCDLEMWVRGHSRSLKVVSGFWSFKVIENGAVR